MESRKTSQTARIRAIICGVPQSRSCAWRLLTQTQVNLIVLKDSSVIRDHTWYGIVLIPFLAEDVVIRIRFEYVANSTRIRCQLTEVYSIAYAIQIDSHKIKSVC